MFHFANPQSVNAGIYLSCKTKVCAHKVKMDAHLIIFWKNRKIGMKEKTK